MGKPKTLPDSIKAHMEAKGVPSQHSLALKMRVSDQCLSDLMRGRRKWPVEIVHAACSALGLDRKEAARLHRVGAKEWGWAL